MTETPILALPEEQSSGPLTREAAAALGFFPEDLDALTQAGVLIPEERSGPWRPETLADVDWIGCKRRQIQAEMAERERVHQVARARLNQALRAFDRFQPDCLEIVLAALPRDRKGNFRAKSLPLETCVVRVTSRKPTLRVTDEARTLAWVTGWDAGDVLLPALRVTVTETHQGPEALRLLYLEGEGLTVTAKLLHREVLAIIEQQPGTVDPETGEVLPLAVPGVELVPGTDSLEWE